jgi:hypothetical protein
MLQTIRIVYSDYWLSPKLKAVDPGLYIYPELRYTFFYIFLFLWSLDGLVVSGLFVRGAISSSRVGNWLYITVTMYFVFLLILILGGSLMLYVRNHGY